MTTTLTVEAPATAPATVEAPPEIAAGVRLLDERGPENWRETIDLDRLNISSPLDCVCGQLYGSYYVGKEILGVQAGHGYGFLDNHQSGRPLNAAWRRYVAATRRHPRG